MEPLWADLINSDWHDYLGQGRDEDRLEDPRWLERFLLRWGLPSIDVESPTSRRRLRELRTLLNRMALKLHSGKKLSSKDFTDINTHLGNELVVRQLHRTKNGYSLIYPPVKASINTVLSEVSASFADLLINGEPTRIRVCENPDCRWIIYDRSKNRSRRWCEGATGCGNIIKVRRYRKRQRKEATSKSSQREKHAEDLETF